MTTGKQGETQPVGPLDPAATRLPNPLVRSTRIETWSITARFPITADERLALLASMGRATVEAAAADLEMLEAHQRTQAAALRAARGPQLTRHSPFEGHPRVAVLGDSLTADRISWFDLLALADPEAQDGRVWTNLAVSGATTADALERFDLLEAARPSLVLVLLGTNDVRRHGRRSPQRMVSPAETERNLRTIATLVRDDLGADCRLLTPPPAAPPLVRQFFAGAPVSLQPSELDDVADLVRSLDPRCIDLHAPMRAAGPARFVEADGLHLNAAGQRFVAEVVLDQGQHPEPVQPADGDRAR